VYKKQKNVIMKRLTVRAFIGFFVISFLSVNLHSQSTNEPDHALTARHKSIITVAAYTAMGDLEDLKTALNSGLDAGLTINEIKEVIVHLYAYCGFPRSIRGLQTFMEVLGQRKERGINDKTGPDASPIHTEQSKYERGKKVLGELTGVPQNETLTGYAAFAPVIDTFLKEHLFADIFERDVLSWADRELVTISVLSAIGGVEPMLRSHLSISLNVGFAPSQLIEFVEILRSSVGEKVANDAQAVLYALLNNEPEKAAEKNTETLFPKGEIITGSNFTGTAWVKMLVLNDSIYNTSIGNVTFEPRARTNWHKHPGGQILLITDGRGFYHEKGKSVQILNKGDIVKIPPDTEHWHGAAPDTSLTHIAISPNTDKGSVIWMKPVSDNEYNKIKVAGLFP
jgi:quercetin dioxygenase-like cupin family protein/alkylhydroperoxidase/carboxymuconolactone decarboxylase family protein YurZ